MNVNSILTQWSMESETSLLFFVHMLFNIYMNVCSSLIFCCCHFSSPDNSKKYSWEDRSTTTTTKIIMERNPTGKYIKENA